MIPATPPAEGQERSEGATSGESARPEPAPVQIRFVVLEPSAYMLREYRRWRRMGLPREWANGLVAGQIHENGEGRVYIKIGGDQTMAALAEQLQSASSRGSGS